LLAAGIPDDAFTPIEGDVKARVTALKKQNKKEREEYKKGQGYLFDVPIKLGNLAAELSRIDRAPDDTTAAVQDKERRYREFVKGTEYQYGRLLADTWCAAFVWKKDDSDLGKLCPTERDFRKVESHAAAGLLPHVRKEVERLRDQYQLFHWHLAFPDVFRDEGVRNKEQGSEGLPESTRSSLADSLPPSPSGWTGGFDVVLGNPPWEMPEVDDREFFAIRNTHISREPSAQNRRTLIKSLALDKPEVFNQWQDHIRGYQGERAFFALSNRFPYASSGRLNYYKLFLESSWQSTAKSGRLGLVVPSGLTTNAYERPLWHSLVTNNHVALVMDFENKQGLFPRIDSRTKFSLLVLSRSHQPHFLTACWLHAIEQTTDSNRVMALTKDDLEKFSPEELALPQFRSSQDLVLLRHATETFGTLVQHKDWSYTPRFMFSSSDAAFRPANREIVETAAISPLNRRFPSGGETLVPVYEGKMVGILDHRQADIYINPRNPARPAQESPLSNEEKADPNRLANPQFWLSESAVRQRRFSKTQADWELVFCDVTSATNERTALACIIPLSGLTRNLPAIYLDSASAKDAALLVALLSTFALDYFARLKVASNHLTQGILATLPIPSRDAARKFAAELFEDSGWFEKRGLELSYTASDIEPFARDFGFNGPPIPWDSPRRDESRAELDAAVFHLYRLSRDQIRYVMQTFPTVRDRDIAETGEYRTERAVLRYFDAMETAKCNNSTYLSKGLSCDTE
jgi:hypothetical protein